MGYVVGKICVGLVLVGESASILSQAESLVK